jgi:fructose/tagatose bisphosphate aldolase
MGARVGLEGGRHAATALPSTLAQTKCPRELIARSRVERFAVGAFNADKPETLRAICRAAQAPVAPVLIEVSQPVDVFGLENARDVLDNEIDALGIEAYFNFDHAPTVSTAMSAINASFEFVHLDLFQCDPEATGDDVIDATREVVAHAQETGALVEGEPRSLTGSSTLHPDHVDLAAVEASLTTPEQARTFVDATGIDTLAVGIGNVHGRHPAPKRLDLHLLARLRGAVDVNLSLHGGSGARYAVYRGVARGGVSKININPRRSHCVPDGTRASIRAPSRGVLHGQAHLAGRRRSATSRGSEDPRLRFSREGPTAGSPT